jgi:hypothetical protein
MGGAVEIEDALVVKHCPVDPDEGEHEGLGGQHRGRGISWPEATAFPKTGFS